MATFGSINSSASVQIGNVQYETPTEGSTVTVSSTTNILILNPAADLTNLTITFPSSPSTGYNLAIMSSQAVANLTISSAKTVNGALTTFSADNTYAQYIYNSTADKFFRCG